MEKWWSTRLDGGLLEYKTIRKTSGIKGFKENIWNTILDGEFLEYKAMRKTAGVQG